MTMLQGAHVATGALLVALGVWSLRTDGTGIPLVNLCGPAAGLIGVGVLVSALVTDRYARRVLVALGLALLAAGTIGVLTLGMVLAHPGDNSDVGMLCSSLMVTLAPAGGVHVLLGLLRLFVRRLRRANA